MKAVNASEGGGEVVLVIMVLMLMLMMRWDVVELKRVLEDSQIEHVGSKVGGRRLCVSCKKKAVISVRDADECLKSFPRQI